MTADLLNKGKLRRQLSKLVEQYFRLTPHVLEERRRQRFEDCQRRGAANGVGAESRSVIAQPQQRRIALVDERRRDRQTSAEPFGQRQHVRLDAIGLIAEKVAGAAEAALNSVE